MACRLRLRPICDDLKAALHDCANVAINDAPTRTGKFTAFTPWSICRMVIRHMAQPNLNTIAEHYSGILKELGADLDSEGMKETPLRAAKALVEMTEGSRMETDQLTKMFKAECQTAVCHDMVIVQGIKEVGLCEHHLLPILMSITIGYVPDKKILGLSKLSRIAGYFARRFQNQERTAHLIAVFIEQIVEPLGVAVLIDGQHMCAMARGVRDTHSIMKVNVMHGAFQKDQHLRNEFLTRLS